MIAAQQRATIINQKGVKEYFNAKGMTLQQNYIEA